MTVAQRAHPLQIPHIHILACAKAILVPRVRSGKSAGRSCYINGAHTICLVNRISIRTDIAECKPHVIHPLYCTASASLDDITPTGTNMWCGVVYGGVDVEVPLSGIGEGRE